MNMRRLLLLLLLGVVISLAFFWVSEKEKDNESIVDVDYQKEAVYWEQEIDRVGAAQAYRTFSENEKYKELNYQIQHDISHIFGQLVYKKAGLEGASICGEYFDFGCQHGFFNLAMYDQGTQAIEEIVGVCDGDTELFAQCLHGLGHGILSYLGDEYVEDAVDVCVSHTSDTAGPSPCASGVFMEFAFGAGDLIFDREQEGSILRLGAIVREPDLRGMHYPCDSVEKSVRGACYLYQSSWWKYAYFNEDASGWKKIGEICTTLQNDEERNSCINGIGYELGSIEYDVEKMIKFCEDMPSVTAEIECLKGVTWSLAPRKEYTDGLKMVCGLLPEGSSRRCAVI